MQKRYRPDGWLGAILGAKLFFDFSGKYPFDKSMQGLLKELRGRGQASSQDSMGMLFAVVVVVNRWRCLRACVVCISVLYNMPSSAFMSGVPHLRNISFLLLLLLLLLSLFVLLLLLLFMLLPLLLF